MGAEGALADLQVSGVADDCEFDWWHLPLLAPDVPGCCELGLFNTRRDIRAISMPTFGVISPDHNLSNAVSIHNEGAKVIQITVLKT
jgi:hypothetical protein